MMHTLGKPPLVSMSRLMEAQHGVRIGLVGDDVYVFGAGQTAAGRAKIDAIKEFSKELRAELGAERAIANAQRTARLQVVRRVA